MPPDYPKKEKNKNFDKEGRLDALEDNLYRADGSKENLKKRPAVSDIYQNVEVRSDWEGGDSDVFEPGEVSSKKNVSMLKHVLIGSVILFVASLGIVSYVFLGGKNVVSTKNILINIDTPLSVAGGEEFPLEISIINQNNVPLISADILIEYGDGARQPDDLGKDMRRVRESIGPVPVGEEINKKYSVVFFGEESESKDVKVTLEYRVSGSNAIFSKSESQTLKLSSAPVSISVESSSEVSSGSNGVFTVTISTNTNKTVEDVLFSADYPFGFEFSGADPNPTYGKNIWDIGDLKPGVTRTFKIHGQFSGSEDEEKATRFSVGSADPKDERKIGVLFLSKSYTTKIGKPFVDLDFVIGGTKYDEYTTAAGRSVRADILFKNNLGDKISDIIIEAKLIGEIFDRNSVSSTKGFFRSIDNTIVWNQQTNQSLSSVSAGSSGSVSFSFDTLKSAKDMYSPSMEIEVTISGNRIVENEAVEKVKVSSNKIIKIVSEMGVFAKVIYSSGPFDNSGPVPPRAEEETTYTVVLSVANSSNDLSNVKVVTSLPLYASWLGKIYPEGENIKYNPIGGEIVWDVGDLEALGEKEASFQISLLPSLSQVNTYPKLLNDISATGYDRFSGATVSANERGPEISMPDDSVYKGKGGPVGK